MEAVFADWRTAPVDDRLRAALGFVEELTLRPAAVGAGSLAPLRAAGLADRDIEDVAIVCSLFSIIVRIADALDFDVPTEAEFARMAPGMLARGYR